MKVNQPKSVAVNRLIDYLFIVVVPVVMPVSFACFAQWGASFDWGAALLGFVVGVVVNFLVGWCFAIWQFRHSMAGHRVRMTVKATQDIITSMPKVGMDALSRSRIRDLHRYSLGVMIDELQWAFGEKGYSEAGPWPCLTDFNEAHLNDGKDSLKDENGKPYDRWGRFVRSVRPVIEDINSSAFIGRVSVLNFWKEDREVRQLNALMTLCKQLECAVATLDAALEKEPAQRLVELKRDPRFGCEPNAPVVIIPKRTSDEGGEERELHTRLRTEFRKLGDAWNEWLDVANAE